MKGQGRVNGSLLGPAHDLKRLEVHCGVALGKSGTVHFCDVEIMWTVKIVMYVPNVTSVWMVGEGSCAHPPGLACQEVPS